jgi:hypothetical protein
MSTILSFERTSPPKIFPDGLPVDVYGCEIEEPPISDPPGSPNPACSYQISLYDR